MKFNLINEVDEELQTQNPEITEVYNRQSNDEEARKGADIRNVIAERMWQDYVFE